jgi:magnesium transporter
MIRVFYGNGSELHWEKNPADLRGGGTHRIIWVDLQEPTQEEKKRVETEFGIEFFTPQEAAEIESSSRYIEDSEGFEANTAFMVKEEKGYNTRQVSFILRGNTLFTFRDTDLNSFAETVRKLKTIARVLPARPSRSGCCSSRRRSTWTQTLSSTSPALPMR